jgi:hypothetical protein
MANDDRKFEGIGYRGLTGYRAPTEQEVQAGITEALRGAVRDAGHNIHQPSSVAAPPAERERERRVGTAGSDNGWVEPKPLAVPSGIDLIDRLCAELLPHGSASRAK